MRQKGVVLIFREKSMKAFWKIVIHTLILLGIFIVVNILLSLTDMNNNGSWITLIVITLWSKELYKISFFKE